MPSDAGVSALKPFNVQLAGECANLGGKSNLRVGVGQERSKPRELEEMRVRAGVCKS